MASTPLATSGLGETGSVARMAGEWAGPETTDLDALTEIVRAMPNGGQVEIVTTTEEIR